MPSPNGLRPDHSDQQAAARRGPCRDNGQAPMTWSRNRPGRGVTSKVASVNRSRSHYTTAVVG